MMPDLLSFDLIVGHPDEIKSIRVEAPDQRAAYDIGHRLFLGCRLALVLLEDEAD